jgi:hypothetical protein
MRPAAKDSAPLEERIRARCTELLNTNDPAAAQTIALELRILTHLFVEELYQGVDWAA